jgi:RNA polymerase sigma-70 factor (ECF subfamily)
MTRTADPFRTLYDANHHRVRYMLVRLVGAHDADDVTQAVFAKAARALPGFRGDADPSTWLHRIAANSASDWLRSRAAHEAKLTLPLAAASEDDSRAPAIAALEADRAPSPEQDLAARDTSACIRGEIAKLPDGYREVLMLSALGGLDDAEIAAILGTTHGNAKVRLHRARHEFKKIIATRCDFYRNELSCKPASPSCCPPPTVRAIAGQ